MNEHRKRQTLVVCGAVGLAALVLSFAIYLWVRVEPLNLGQILSRLGSTQSRQQHLGEKLQESEPTLSTAAESFHRAIPTLRSRIVDPSNKGLSGAQISWTSLDDAPQGDWPDTDWRRHEQRSVHAISNINGEFELATSPPDAASQPSVIWITHPGYSARRLMLDGIASLAALPDVITLASAGHLIATVIDPLGKPISNAQVLQLAYMGNEDPSSSNDLDRRALSVLRREAYTGSSGIIDLPAFPGTSWVWAESAQSRSFPWSGRAPASFRLQIGDSFSAYGRVFLPPEVPSIEPHLGVRSFVRDGGDLHTLTRATVRQDGSWGPIQLAFRKDAIFGFELEGFQLTHETVLLDETTPGAQSQIDFHPQRALHTAVRVIDTHGTRISGALVEGLWNAMNAWHKVSATTNESGIAQLGGLHGGSVYIAARADGFAQSSIDVDIPAAQDTPIVMTLSPAGSIQGRCLFHGNPVESFAIHWLQDPDFRGEDQSFTDAPDGRYCLNHVMPGQVWVIASSPSHSQSLPRQVTVMPGACTTADIELQDEVVGHGTVLDGVSSKPVAHATVQLYAHYRGTRIHVVRNPAFSDSAGVFQLQGMTIGLNVFEVTAPGYQTAEVIRDIADDTLLDLGIIPLFTKQNVEVLLSGSVGDDPTQYRASLLSPSNLQPKSFDINGKLHIEGVDPGKYTLRVLYPRDESYDDIRVAVMPGSDSKIRVLVQSQIMTVEVIPHSNESRIPENLVLRVHQGSSEGVLSTDHVYGIPPDGHVVIGAVEGDVTVDVLELDRTCRGFTHTLVKPGSKPTLRVELDVNPVEFHVTDASLTAFPNAFVGLYCAPACTDWYTQGISDQSGVCRFTGLSIDTAFVNVGRLPEGFMPAVQMSLTSASKQPIELRLEPDCLLYVLALERSHPVAGLQLEALDAQVSASLGTAATDQNGSAQFCRVGKGHWLVNLSHPGYWRDQFLVSASCDGAPFPIEVRQLGELELKARDRTGQPVSHLSIDLYSEEKGRWVSEWISEGRVPAPQQGLTTDVDGNIRFTGLPNGVFRWRAGLPDGSSLEGLESVPAHGVAIVSISAP